MKKLVLSEVEGTEGGQTTLYVNQYFEKNLSTQEVTTHYYLGGKEVAFKKGSTLEYLHTDHLGSTSVTTNTSGAQVSTVKYFPFGGARSQTGTLDTDKRFTGQRLDQTGLYYYGARYYDATIGRFISPDTIVPNPANPQSLNRYSYCLNNPLRYVDPTGHDPNPDIDPATGINWGHDTETGIPCRFTNPLLTGVAYVFVGGSGQTSAAGWSAMAGALGVPINDVFWVPDLDPDTFNWSLNIYSATARMALLQERLMDAYAIGVTQIHIVAHSEGGAAVVKMLHEWLNGTSAIPIEVASCISSISLIDIPYGGTVDRDWFVSGYKGEWASGLPAKLSGNSSLSHIRMFNVYHKGSPVQDRSLRGWGKQSQSVDTRSRGHRAGVYIGELMVGVANDADALLFFDEYHGHLHQNEDVIKKVAANVGG